MFHTLITRWYVFVFLAAFLVIGIRTRGVGRTLVFLATGYLIAWVSEALSIRTGFPYGWYFYIYENLQGELMNWGVPVWDSLSYVFLCFAGWSLAEFVTGKIPPVPPLLKGGNLKLPPLKKGGQGGFKLAVLSALFVLILDIIVDPLAHLGDQWFLGKIYYYPNPGFYFGVPLSNFAGWFFVAFAIVGINLSIDNLLKRSTLRLRSGQAIHDLRSTPFAKYSGPLLYFGIFFFNFAITLWIKQWLLAFFDLVWILIPAYLFIRSLRAQAKQSQGAGREIASSLRSSQ